MFLKGILVGRRSCYKHKLDYLVWKLQEWLEAGLFRKFLLKPVTLGVFLLKRDYGFLS